MRTDMRKILLVVCLGLPFWAPNVMGGSFIVEDEEQAQVLRSRILATQFLSRASFGGKPAEIDALAAEIRKQGYKDALEFWIDHQFGLPASFHEPVAEKMLRNHGYDLDRLPEYKKEDKIWVPHYRSSSWWHVVLGEPEPSLEEDTSESQPSGEESSESEPASKKEAVERDQLRQRMAWALAQIFVVNDAGNGFNNPEREAHAPNKLLSLGVLHYYDMLVRNAFGNYRELLGEVTLHPVMGTFLGHAYNAKETATRQPDENYAREVQQLFSIGLYELDAWGRILVDENTGEPLASYTNDDIVEFARVFTGLGFAGEDHFGSYQRNFHEPMIMYERFHDQGEKRLLGVDLDAGRSVLEDIASALDILFHHDNTAPFIARLLIQRLVKSNPSGEYIYEVGQAFADNGQGVRGDFKAVIKAILLNPEALYSLRFEDSVDASGQRRITVSGGGTEHSRLMEPVLLYSAFLRAFKASSTHPEGYFALGELSHSLGQQAHRAPSVFNFYLPDHQPAGPLQDYKPSGNLPNGRVSAPEFQIMTDVAANRYINRVRDDIRDLEVDITFQAANGPYSYKIALNIDDELALAHDPDALLAHLDIKLCHGTLSDELRDTLSEILENTAENVHSRSRAAILALAGAPDCVVHE